MYSHKTAEFLGETKDPEGSHVQSDKYQTEIKTLISNKKRFKAVKYWLQHFERK